MHTSSTAVSAARRPARQQVRTGAVRSAVAALALLAGAVAPVGAVAAPTPPPAPATGAPTGTELVPGYTATKSPCPGTLAPPPPRAPHARHGAAVTPPPTPTPTGAPARHPAPRVDAGPHPVGGDQLGTASLVASLPAGVPAPPELDATSYVLADQTTGAVLVAKAPHAKLFPASTLKTLTSLTLLPRVPAGRTIVATPADQNAEGTRVGMVAGNPYRSEQLWSALLMFSANDAAYALARTAPGGVPGSVAAMNATAAAVGARDTHVVDPSGLDQPAQTSSAYDLAVIGREAMKRKDFRGYVGTRTITFPGARQPDGRVVAPFQVANLNHFWWNYPGATGVKTGYTTGAHRTFIGSATRGGRSYLISYMCSDTVSWQHVGALMDWAFAHGAAARPVGTLAVAGQTTAPTTGASPAGRSSSPTPAVTTGPGAATAPVTESAAAATPVPLVGPASASSPAQRWWPAGVLVGLAAVLAGVLVRRRPRRGRPTHRS
ncbi:hypothetical protein [Arsenicicoccus dermatophilus]|uniref:D-alanyl-D-alanine carboxypeptidase family protein n=1 Tax=Arsenicicoccus dermatophilus TaxID=1076331 RepID=UPI003917245F